MKTTVIRRPVPAPGLPIRHCEEQGDAKALIIEGDAWEVVKDFDDNSIDAIITDSGYSCLNKHYNNGSRSSKTTSQGNNIGFQTRDVDDELLISGMINKVSSANWAVLPELVFPDRCVVVDAGQTLKIENTTDNTLQFQVIGYTYDI